MEPATSENQEKNLTTSEDAVASTESAASESLGNSSAPQDAVASTESAASEGLGNPEHLENSIAVENVGIDGVVDNHDEAAADVDNGGMGAKHEFKEEDIRGTLELIAATGKFWHRWDILKGMLSFHLSKVLSEYPEAKMTTEQQNSSLGETFLDLRKRLHDAVDSFIEGPPFTLQRFCEILLAARSIYPKLSKLALALEKNLSVTSTLTISSDHHPPAAVQKPSVAEPVTDLLQSQTNSVENGVKHATGDGDEIMAEVEEADVDDAMTIDMETFEEIVKSSEPDSAPAAAES